MRWGSEEVERRRLAMEWEKVVFGRRQASSAAGWACWRRCNGSFRRMKVARRHRQSENYFLERWSSRKERTGHDLESIVGQVRKHGSRTKGWWRLLEATWRRWRCRWARKGEWSWKRQD
jgi:hypothetical protein